jgi:hypothetical protein
VTSTIGDIALAWQESNINETAHQIERSTNNINWTQAGTVAANVTAFTDTSALCNQNYYYRVRAYRAVDNAHSPYSESVLTAITICLQDGPIFDVTTTDGSNDTYCEVEDCTLREAFLAARTIDNSTIRIPAGMYTPPNAGEMTITRNNVRIEGVGSAQTIINFNGQYPGIVVAANASATIVDVTVKAASTSNISANSGASLTVEDSIVRDALRGGIRGNTANITVVRSQILDNDNNVSGGGIGAVFGTLTVRDTLVSGNFLIHTGSVQYGAGIYKYGIGDVIIENSTVSNNLKGFAGQGIALEGITGSTNIYRITNTTVTGHHTEGITPDGIFIYAIEGANPILEHVTVTGNDDGINVSPSTIIRHSIIAGNLVNIRNSTPIDGGYNIISGDPLLVPLRNNGGLTPTHNLFVGSPAYNAIPAGACTLALDQRGISRPVDGACDIGAVEATASVPHLLVPTGLSGVAVTAPNSASIQLTWTDNASDETVYYVERRLSSEATLTRIAEIAANSNAYQNVLPVCRADTFYYRVQAYRATDAILSAYSNIATVTISSCPAPLAPSNMTATSERDHIIRILWTDNSNDETAFFYEESKNNGPWDYVLQTSANGFGASFLAKDCGVNYSYRVRAYRSTDNTYSAYSNVASITIVCPPPTALTVQDNGTSMRLDWVDNMTRETGYRIERRLLDGEWIEIGTVGQSVTTYTDTTAICSSGVAYRVRGYLQHVNTYSDYSDVVSDSFTCQPPANLIVTGTEATTIHLAWDDVMSSESQYHVERLNDDGTAWVEVAILAANSEVYSDSGLNCERPYSYRIRAYRTSDALFTGYSNLATAITATCPVPRPPVNVTAAGTSRNTITVNWNDNNLSAVTYRIEHTAVGTNNWVQIAEIAAGVETFVNNNLLCNRSYDYRMRAFRPADSLFSSYSPLTTATTLACPPLDPPPPPPIDPPGRSSATLTLPAMSDVTTYYIERQTINPPASNPTWVQVAAVPATTTEFTDNGLNCGRSYAYRLRAYRVEDNSYSSYSSETTIITAPCPIPVTNTVGLYRNGLWQFRDFNATGAATIQFYFGPREAGWIALTGDWDGDGVDGIGLYKNGLFILRNISEQGSVELSFRFGAQESGWQPIVGDWNGDGVDTIGVYRNGQFYLRDSNAEGTADYRFNLGAQESGWQAVAGDWDASGRDSVGLYRNGYFYLTNSLDGVGLRRPFQFGPVQSGWKAITGDWNADGVMSVGLYNGSIWRLRNTNDTGASDLGFNFGTVEAGWQPLASYRGGSVALAMLAQSAMDTPLVVPTEPVITATSEATEGIITPVATATPEVTAEVTELVIESTATVVPTEAVITPEPTAEITTTPLEPEPVATATPAVSPEPTAEVTPETTGD